MIIISSLCKSVRFHLRNIGFIRGYLTCTATEQIVHALISSRLDFCNSLMYNSTQLNRLQRIHNSAARLVSLTKHSDHITPLLRSPNGYLFEIVSSIRFSCLHFTQATDQHLHIYKKPYPDLYHQVISDHLNLFRSLFHVSIVHGEAVQYTILPLHFGTACRLNLPCPHPLLPSKPV